MELYPRHLDTEHFRANHPDHPNRSPNLEIPNLSTKYLQRQLQSATFYIGTLSKILDSPRDEIYFFAILVTKAHVTLVQHTFIFELNKKFRDNNIN